MKFSVIIPTYNNADIICEAVDSVKKQTVPGCEIIVVNDGSNDDTLKVLAKYQNIKVLSQKNGGVSAARNAGIEAAQGEYICFLDGDDLWEANHLEVLIDLMEKYPEVGYYITSHKVELDNGHIRHSNRSLEKCDQDFFQDDLLELLNTHSYGIVHTNSICVKKSILDQYHIRFEVGAKIGEDTDVWYRIGLYNSVAISKKETTVYRRVNSRATKNGYHVFDWVFVGREKDILACADISAKRKQSVCILLDRFKMTSSRAAILSGDRTRAKEILKLVHDKRSVRFQISQFLCMMPSRVFDVLYRIFLIVRKF